MPKKPAVPTQDDVAESMKDALLQVMRSPDRHDEGMTVDELSEATAHSKDWVYKHLRRAIAEGRVKHGRRSITGIDGRSYQTPVYKLVKRS